MAYLHALLPDEILKAAELLKGYHREMVYFTRNPTVAVVGTHWQEGSTHVLGTYSIALPLPETPVPGCDYMDKGRTEYSQAVKDWAALYKRTQVKVNRAETYFTDCVNACASAGQIKRALPDLVQYLSEGPRKSLEEAQRKSRYPKGFAVDVHRYEEAMTMLALGHVSPVLSYAERNAAASVRGFAT